MDELPFNAQSKCTIQMHYQNAAFFFRPACVCKENEDIRDLTLAGLVNMVQRACLVSIRFTL